MGQIRLLLLTGPDLPDAARTYLATLFAHLEWEWFDVAVAGEADLVSPDVPVSARVGLSPGSGWFGGRRELRRLRDLARAYDLVDCHGYQALAYAARAGVEAPRTLYTRHRIPAERSDVQRERWLMHRVSAVLAPSPALAAGAGARVRLVPLAAGAHGSAAEFDPAAARARLGLPADSLAVVSVLLDGGADRELAAELIRRHPEVQWLYLRGGLGERLPVSDPGLAVAASDLVLFPRRETADDGGVLDGALGLGRAVVASRVPGVVGRLRCLTEGYLLPVGAVEAWDEVVSALIDDPELRTAVAGGARRAYGPGGPGQVVRVLESQYAGVLMAATGECPVCEPGA